MLTSTPAAHALMGGFSYGRSMRGPDEEEKSQIFERIVLALQIITEGESVHPRVCWHPHKQVIVDCVIHVVNKLF